MIPVKTQNVFQTKDYDAFEFMVENRKVVPRHIDELKASITEHGYLQDYPVHVVQMGKKFKIIDGQHRFSACRQLGAPVYFIIRDSENAAEDLRTANTTAKSWRDEDYLGHFVALGYEPYRLLERFMLHWDLPIMAALAVLSGSVHGVKAERKKFRYGGLVFTEEQMAEADKIMTMVNDIRFVDDRLKPLRRDKGFIAACVTAINAPYYNHDRMMRHLPKSLMFFARGGTIKDYLRVLSTTYNRHMRDELRVDFNQKGLKSVKREWAEVGDMELEQAAN